MPTAREKHQALWHLVTDWRDRADEMRTKAKPRDSIVRGQAEIFDYCASRLEDALGTLT